MGISDDAIIRATCAVLIKGIVKGTAWLFSSRGHLLTAGHLLGEPEPYAHVYVRFGDDTPLRAKRIAYKLDREKGIDFAVLQ